MEKRKITKFLKEMRNTMDKRFDCKVLAIIDNTYSDKDYVVIVYKKSVGSVVATLNIDGKVEMCYHYTLDCSWQDGIDLINQVAKALNKVNGEEK